MKAGEVRICPSCQTRNKAKWEFCVRCGESLQGVRLGEGAAGAAPAAVEAETDGVPFPWISVVGALLALVGAAALV